MQTSRTTNSFSSETNRCFARSPGLSFGAASPEDELPGYAEILDLLGAASTRDELLALLLLEDLLQPLRTRDEVLDPLPEDVLVFYPWQFFGDEE